MKHIKIFLAVFVAYVIITATVVTKMVDYILVGWTGHSGNWFIELLVGLFASPFVFFSWLLTLLLHPH